MSVIGDGLVMKHGDWLRLRVEGEKICAVLRQKGYDCQKQGRRLSWWVSQSGSYCYRLTYLPAPVEEWRLLPDNTHPSRKRLLSILKRILESMRGESMIGLAEDQVCLSSGEDDSHPWTIVRLLPDARCCTVARFCNRQDADDQVRFLQRYVPGAKFEVVFDPQ